LLKRITVEVLACETKVEAASSMTVLKDTQQLLDKLKVAAAYKDAGTF
jgi:hypothetical protein